MVLESSSLDEDTDTGDVQPGFALGQARTEAKREKVAALAMELYQFLGDEEKSMNSVAAHLKRELGDQEYRLQLMGVGAQHLSDVVRLFDDLELTPDIEEQRMLDQGAADHIQTMTLPEKMALMRALFCRVPV